MQNGHVELFYGRFRDECLNPNWSTSFAQAHLRCSTRECLRLEVETALPVGRVRYDNVAELTSSQFLAWAIENRIELLHTAGPADAERARGDLQRQNASGFLNTNWFRILFDA